MLTSSLLIRSGHRPAVEVVLGHALLGEALHAVDRAVALGHRVALEPRQLVAARVRALVQLVAAADSLPIASQSSLMSLIWSIRVVAVRAAVELVEQRPQLRLFQSREFQAAR